MSRLIEISKTRPIILLAACFLTLSINISATANSLGNKPAEDRKIAGQNHPDAKHKSDASADAAASKVEGSTGSPSVEDRLKAMEQLIERQQREIQSLRQMVEMKRAESVNARSSESAQPTGGQPKVVVAADQTPASGKNEASPPETQ